jgi:hypothetical protein
MNNIHIEKIQKKEFEQVAVMLANLEYEVYFLTAKIITIN